MSRYFENKKLKEGLAVGETFNKALNSMNKTLEEERDKYRDMVFDLQQENADLKEEVGCIETDFNTFKSRTKEIIKNLMEFAEIDCREYEEAYKEAEQFVKE